MQGVTASLQLLSLFFHTTRKNLPPQAVSLWHCMQCRDRFWGGEWEPHCRSSGMIDHVYVTNALDDERHHQPSVVNAILPRVTWLSWGPGSSLHRFCPILSLRIGRTLLETKADNLSDIMTQRGIRQPMLYNNVQTYFIDTVLDLSKVLEYMDTNRFE